MNPDRSLALRIPSTFTSAHAYAGMMVMTLAFLIGAWALRRSAGVGSAGCSTRRWPSRLVGVFAAAARSPVIILALMLLTVFLTVRLKAHGWAFLLIMLAGVGWVVSSEARLQRFTTLSDVEFVSERVSWSVNDSFTQLLTEYPLGNGLGGGGTSMPYFLRERSQPAELLHGERVRAHRAWSRACSASACGPAFIVWLFTRRTCGAQTRGTSGRRLTWVACAAFFATGMIGKGLLTSIPGTALMLLGAGWIAVRRSRWQARSRGRRTSGVAPVGRQPKRRCSQAVCLSGRRAARERGDARDPWLIVAGGFHARGGMDKANAALAAYLLERGHDVHLVAHDIDPTAVETRARTRSRRRAAARLHAARRATSVARRGPRDARAPRSRTRARASSPTAGTSSRPTSTGFTRYTRAWPPTDAGAPAWFRAKNRLWHSRACRRERRARARAPRRRQLRAHAARPSRTRRRRSPRAFAPSTSGGDAGPATGARARGGAPLARHRRRATASSSSRARSATTTTRASTRSGARGALLSAREGWDASAARRGRRARPRTLARAHIAGAGLADGVRFLDFSERLAEVFAASDLLVSPVRYEAYGLNVHEAVCRGVPRSVSRAGRRRRTLPGLLSPKCFCPTRKTPTTSPRVCFVGGA